MNDYISALHQRFYREPDYKEQEEIQQAYQEVWFEDYAKLKVRPSSHQTYRGYIDNHIVPNIEDISLEKITSLKLQKLYKRLLTKERVDWLEAKGQP